MKSSSVLLSSLLLFISPVFADEVHNASNSTESLAASQNTQPTESISVWEIQKFIKENLPAYEKSLNWRFLQLSTMQGDELKLNSKKLIRDVVIKVSDEGKTLDLLKAIRKTAAAAGKLPPELKDEAKANDVLATISMSIDNSLQYQGLSKHTAGKVKYEQWSDLSTRVHENLNSKVAALSESQSVAKLDDPKFWELLDQQANTHATAANEVALKVNGIEAFKTRDEMFARASRSIEVLSWSFENDQTGIRYADLLIAKAKAGIDVKVMVDGQTAQRSGYKEQLARMAAGGVKVVRWMSNDSLRKFDGQHRKMTIVDGKEMIAGGMNYGDVYSHDRSNSKIKWRDTDVLFKGPAAGDASNLFAKLWNEQLKRPENRSKSAIAITTIAKSEKENVKGSVRTISQNPANEETIMRTNLLLIKAAQKEINIENAYFIADPALQRALTEAISRGVKVRILSNSSQSIDVPEIANPILKSINALVAHGAEAYVKKGDTLHTKSFQVDGKAGWVGSWNMHPRSHRIEGEMLMLSRDPKFNKQQSEMFENDIKATVATKVTQPLPITSSAMSDIFETYGFDLL